MNLHNVLESAFGTAAKIRILRVLFASPQPLSGRQVGELAQLSHRGAIQALTSLVDLGAVRQRRVGKAYQYSLSRGSAAVEMVIAPGIKAEAALIQDLKNHVVSHLGKKAVSLTLFGSLARGTETKGSDIDVLAVAKDDHSKRHIEEQAGALIPFFRERFNALLSLHCFTLVELRKKKTLPLIQSVMKGGMSLSGKQLNELLR